MKRSAILGACLGLGLLTAGAAQAELYPYPTNENYCPAGFQPVVMGGVICCGKPTSNVTYSQMMTHPAPKKKIYAKRKTYSARAHCAEGVKGCS